MPPCDGRECFIRGEHIKYNKKITIATSGVSAPRRYKFTEIWKHIKLYLENSDVVWISNLCMKTHRQIASWDEMQDKLTYDYASTISKILMNQSYT